MVSNRVISFPRQIIVCLSLSLVIFLFALSCQKDEGIKHKDPNALTTAQAKDYFEQTAQTLKFLTTGITPAGTKNADYSLTENMVIEWDYALEGENAESFFVEVPIRMTSPVTAMLYDGLGHINKNICQVPLNTSLLIEKHKYNGCMHHSVVTTVGTYSKSVDNSKYGYLSDKSSFTGYQIFCTEEGSFLNSKRYDKGQSESRYLYTETQLPKIDSLGNDLKYRGISFIFFKGALTKGEGNISSGEDHDCPICGRTTVYWGIIEGGAAYYCANCSIIISVFIDTSEDRCEKCQLPKSQCICKCPVCGEDPCVCNGGEGDDQLCPHCREYGCDGSCQNGNGNGNNGAGSGYNISAIVDVSTPYGTISIEPEKAWYVSNDTITLSASPFTGYHFAGWKLDGSIVSTQNPYSFTVHVNQTYYAVFEIDE